MLDGSQIEEAQSAKLLGLVIGNKFKRDNQINSVCNILCSGICILRNLKFYGTLSTKRALLCTI